MQNWGVHRGRHQHQKVPEGPWGPGGGGLALQELSSAGSSLQKPSLFLQEMSGDGPGISCQTFQASLHELPR